MLSLCSRRLLIAVLLLACPTWAWGWHTRGHQIVARAAVKVLPEEVPAWFGAGQALVAHCSVDPDAVKDRALPQLRSTEYPEHFIDLELLQGRALPQTRYEYITLLQELGQDPARVGMAPYAIAEWAQRLTMALAEHRRWPDNEAARLKCQVYAGVLAHYAADLCMPLHTTVHYDGRADASGKSPHSGIHNKVDHLIEQLQLDPAAIAAGVEPEVFEALMPAIQAVLDESHAMIDRVYELEPHLPGAEAQADQVAAPVVEFTESRARAAAHFLASLYLTAWRDSAGVQLPDWLVETRESER